MSAKTVTTSPTQELRNLIDDLRYGMAGADDLDNALLTLEARLHLPLTTAKETQP